MSSIASFSGLASGIQWRDMIDQIMVGESRVLYSVQDRITLVQSRTKAWEDFKTKVTSLQSAAAALSTGGKLRGRKAAITGVASGAITPLAATAGQSAVPGTYSVGVNRLATAEKLGSASFGARDEALGVAGEFRINARVVTVQATDSLDTIARRINEANTGSSASGVSASVVSTGTDAYRLVLTAGSTGAAGISLVDGGTSALHSLGFLDADAAIKNQLSSGARSDLFENATTSVGTLLDFASAVSGNLTIGGVDVAVDLANDSLTEIATAVNTALAAAGKAITARVAEETTDDGTFQRLVITGTTNFAQSSTDGKRIGEALGLLEAGRSAVQQQVQGARLTAGDAVTGVDASTAWSSVWAAGTTAGVVGTDTVTVSGTWGDSSFSFSETLAGNVGDLLARLNGADGFNGQATAALVDGRIVVTDNTAGESRLSLSIVAHNEGGGTLDLGDFTVAQTGRAREITAGQDAEVVIDGTRVTSSRNVLSSAISGVTLNLLATSETAVTLNVSRDDDAAVMAVGSFIDAYNALARFVDGQLVPPAGGGAAPALYGNSTLRSMRTQLREALLGSISSSVAGAYTRLALIGSEIDDKGQFSKNTSTLRDALATDAEAVYRLLAPFGTASSGLVTYQSAEDATAAGDYAVNITTAATAASTQGAALGAGFTYVDDGTPDYLVLRDVASNSEYRVALSHGDSLATIAANINAEVARAQRQQLTTAQPLHSDALGTLASESTLWSQVHRADGTSAGVATGDIITITGVRPDGTAVNTQYVVPDVTTGTLGDFRSAVQTAMGSGVSVSFENGVLTATSRAEGTSLLSFALTAGNEGGGALDFGGLTVTTTGRGAAALVASSAGDRLTLTHGDYGDAAGFEVSWSGGGADGTAQLGLAAGTYLGVDVAGTIGGNAASGSGQVLTGAADTPVEGLALTYTGSSTGSAGTLTFSRGLASALELVASSILGTEYGSVHAITEQLDGGIATLESRVDTLEARLERRRDSLIRQFTAMEAAMSRAQSQSAWLTAQLAQFEPKRK